MPELPEVETARRIIEQTVVGSELTGATVRLQKMLRLSPIPDINVLIGRTLLSAGRRAKILILQWTGDVAMLVHLKLSGQISAQRDGQRRTAGHPIPDPTGPFPHKTTHVSLDFDNGYTLHLSDLRQFGWIRIMDTADVPGFIDSQAFGPEANTAGGIDPTQLLLRLAKKKIPVKTALLDQTVVAGIGNIYVDEALHRAHLHPMTPSNLVTADQMQLLTAAIEWAIGTGIEQGGARIIHNKAYPIDGFPEVHARKGEACPVCGDVIVKIKVGSRGTYLCPTCQPEPYGLKSVVPSI